MSRIRRGRRRRRRRRRRIRRRRGKGRKIRKVKRGEKGSNVRRIEPEIRERKGSWIRLTIEEVSNCVVGLSATRAGRRRGSADGMPVAVEKVRMTGS